MTDKLSEIKRLQKAIVSALEKGQDVSELSRELARVRATIAAEAEVEELKKIASQRQALRDKAEAVKEKVKKQGEAIDALLTARDKLIGQLQPLIEPMGELSQLAHPSWERDPGSCYLFNDVMSFQASVTGIPRELLGAGFACPTLEMTEPGERSPGKATQALQYLRVCVGILASFRKGTMTAYSHPTDSGLLLDVESDRDSYADSPCKVCRAPEREAIDQALKGSKSLRDIEAQYGISRSSLSRHKNRCLNLGAVRVEPESPTSSACQTFLGSD